MLADNVPLNSAASFFAPIYSTTTTTAINVPNLRR
jgi:hypothetical protein